MTCRPNQDQDRVMGCRHELKYLVSAGQARAIAAYLKPFVPMDPYSLGTADGQYPITSLYLDSQSLQLYQESMSGQKNRFKLRVRGYSDAPDAPLFLEIKRRINGIILKSRARIGKSELEPLLQSVHAKAPAVNAASVIRQFQLYRASLAAKPQVLIRYLRTAFEGGEGCRVRITFDRQLMAKVTPRPEVVLGGPGWQRIPLHAVILEIKFTGFFPGWVSDLVKHFGLRAQSVSKYTASIRQAQALRFCAPLKHAPGADLHAVGAASVPAAFSLFSPAVMSSR